MKTEQLQKLRSYIQAEIEHMIKARTLDDNRWARDADIAFDEFVDSFDDVEELNFGEES